ncbi:MAG: hypothetical protein LWX83_15215 [Anaerolineae bacterium]|nr:hypothetical protein [Anaerolineae bacterium]
MKFNPFKNNYTSRIEIAAWDMAIAGMTHSRIVQESIRQGARLRQEVNWKKEGKWMGLIASGGLVAGSLIAAVFFLVS